MITECPNCGSSNLDLAQNVCLNCYARLDADPMERPQPTETIEDLQEATNATASAATPEDQERKLQHFEEKVLERYARGFRVVTLIGFSGAGKSFFANRLRRELALGDWTSEPVHQDTVKKTDSLIDWTQLVKRGDPGHRRVLADCDGEAFSSAVDSLVAGRDLDPFLRRYVVITAVASAFILMLPAPALLNRPNDTLTSKLIERFGTIVKAILALQRAVRETGNARDVVQRGLQRENVMDAMESEFRCDLPIHVLFAQADLLPKGRQHDLDPHMFAITHATSLYRTVEQHFPTFRFDFVCAFDGHRDNPAAAVDYDLPSYGAVPAFEWIDEMIDGGRLKRARSGAAFKARRIVDRTFRRATTWVSR